MSQSKTRPHVVTVIADQLCFDINVVENHARDMIIEDTACMTMLRDRRWSLVPFVRSGGGRSLGVDAEPRNRGPCGTPPPDPVGDATGPRVTPGWRALPAMTKTPLQAPTR